MYKKTRYFWALKAGMHYLNMATGVSVNEDDCHEFEECENSANNKEETLEISYQWFYFYPCFFFIRCLFLKLFKSSIMKFEVFSFSFHEL